MTRRTLKFRGLRPSPSTSATSCTIGTQRRGGDGRQYIVTRRKNGSRFWKATSPRRKSTARISAARKSARKKSAKRKSVRKSHSRSKKR